MKALLLAAGLGTRLSPLTDHLPKCLMPVNGRPLLEYWLTALQRAGITEVLINLHHHAGIVKSWLGHDASSLHIETVHEPSLLGTGGTLLANRHAVGNKPSMLVHADNLCGADLNGMIDAHRARPDGTEITMMTFNTPTPETCGIVELDRSGVVRGFHEKSPSPPGRLANAAVYIVEPPVIDFINDLGRPVVDFSTDVIPAFLGRIYTFHNRVYHRDIGNPESLIAAQIEFPCDAAAPVGAADGWNRFCRLHGERLAPALADALAETRNARPVTWPGPGLPDGESPPERIVLHLPSLGLPDDRRLRTALNHCRRQSEVLIFFTSVPGGFSARAFHEQWGLKSIALCAGGRGEVRSDV